MSNWTRKFYEAIAAGNLDMTNDPWMKKIYNWFVANGFPDEANQIAYDNSTFGVNATNLQQAIDASRQVAAAAARALLPL